MPSEKNEINVTPFPATLEEATLEPGRRREGQMWCSAFGVSDEKWVTELPYETSPVQVVSALFLDGPIEYEVFQERVRSRILAIPRFRSRMERKPGKGNTMVFVEMDVNEIDLNYHIQVVDQGDEVWSEQRLCDFVDDIKSERIKADAPRWQFFLVQNLERGNPVIVTNVYHCIADGSSLVAVLTRALTDNVNENASVNGGNSEDDKSLLAGRTVARRAPPPFPWYKKVRAVLQGYKKSLLGIALPADYRSKLKLKNHRRPSSRKATGWSTDIPVDVLKKLRDANPGSSLHDVILSVMTVMFKLYFEAENDPVIAKKKTMRGSFSMDLRKPGSEILSEEYFGNAVGVMDCKFPLHKDVKDIIMAVNKQTSYLKHSPESIVRNKLLSVAMNHAKPNEKLINLFLDSTGKTTCMVSNVRGPEEYMYICGKRVEDIRFSVQIPVGVALGLITYAGKVSASASTDPICESEPRKLVSQFVPAVKLLCEANNVEFPETGNETESQAVEVPVPVNVEVESPVEDNTNEIEVQVDSSSTEQPDDTVVEVETTNEIEVQVESSSTEQPDDTVVEVETTNETSTTQQDDSDSPSNIVVTTAEKGDGMEAQEIPQENVVANA